MGTLGHFLIAIFCMIASGLFSATETALFSLSKIEKRRLAERHPRVWKWIANHLEHPRRTLLTILIGNLFVNTLVASLVTLIVSSLWGPRYLTFGIAIFTVVFIFFCEILPKVISVRKDEKVAMLTAFPLEIIAVLLSPIRRVTRFVTDWIVSFLIHEKKEHVDVISEEELKALVKIGEEEGVIDRDERKMIQKFFELGERPVRTIMTPRIDMVALDAEDPSAKHVEMMKKYHFSSFPVYQGSPDNILGVLFVQDYMLNSAKGIQGVLKQPIFIPETKRIDDLLEDFRRIGERLAICVDEYGGTAGIVTLEDILEEIFGEFYDEYAAVTNPIRKLSDREYLVEAKISLVEFNEFFSTHFESKEISTLGGLILEKMGKVPEKGKVLELDKHEVRIHDVIRQRIKTVIVRQIHD
ncbi:MAG: HlyC/CorC family transporter [Candidatus Omnitrophica bacterium]|nr:HlyC/CorC family transporter [Candidatus Omnitrophota bacterium]